MEYKIKDVCNSLKIGVSKFYKIKQSLEHSIPEQNRVEYYYNKGRNFYITDKGLNWFKNNLDNFSKNQVIKNNNSSNIVLYQNQVIELYKSRIEYLEAENKRLLDIIALKEQKEITKDIKYIKNNDYVSFWDKLLNKIKK